MSDSNEHIVVFENVSASVGGIDISSIAELGLVATANSIPKITLVVDAGESGGAGQRYADTVSLDNAREILDTCQEMVKKDGATLSLSLTCRDIGAGGATERLSISGWLLSDVAISTIQRRGACMVSMTFQHPLCKAHFGGAVPGLLGKGFKLKDMTGDNPFSVFIAGLRAYADANRTPPIPAYVDGASDTGAVVAALLKHLGKATDSLEAALSWEGGQLPAENIIGGWHDLLVHGVSKYAAPSGGTSVFQTFMSSVVPECSLAVGGDYTQSKLTVGPFKPWAPASLTIDDSNVTGLQFPASDPSPIAGVKIAMSASGVDTITTFTPRTAQVPMAGRAAEAFYVPDSQLDADYMYGPIQLVREPLWLVEAASCSRPVSSTYMSDAVQAGGNLITATTVGRGKSPTGGGGGGSNIPATDYASAAIACAKAYYETSLMKDWAFTVNARFMLSAGGIICPGKVLSVKSGSGEVIGGYIVSVEHTVSVSSRAAHTRITCTHPRFGKLPDGITSGENALYR